MTGKDDERPPGDLLVYQGQGLDDPIQVRLEGETVWLNQKLMAELYGVSVPTVNEHIANIYHEEELRPEATIRKFRIVQAEGNRQVGRLVDHYNLDILAAGGTIALDVQSEYVAFIQIEHPPDAAKEGA